MPSFHRCGNNLYTTLAANVAAIDTTIDVAPSGLDDLPVPFLADLGGEVVEVTLVAEDTPSPGTTRWTVTRAYYGVAGVYTAGIPVAQRNYAEQFNELQDFNVAAWLGVVSTLGADTGVIGAPDESRPRSALHGSVQGVSVSGTAPFSGRPHMTLTLGIDDVARRTGLTVHTLRYYERIGLIAAVGRAPR